MHSVAYFIEGILKAHDKTEVEVTCYHNSHEADSVTQRLMASTDRWREVYSLSDQELTELIVSDEIDVLVDLAGYTNGNRLGVFARKPAPVQVTWIGYPNTTGLSTMDYRLVDDVTDQADTDRYHSEQLIRLPGALTAIPVTIRPRFMKICPTTGTGTLRLEVLITSSRSGPGWSKAWSRVLSGVPGSGSS